MAMNNIRMFRTLHGIDLLHDMHMEEMRQMLMDHPDQRLPQLRAAAAATSPTPRPAPELTPSPAPDIGMISSTGWSEDSLLRAGGSNFNRVPRISASLPPEEMTVKLLESEASGVPLIIEGWHLHPGWNSDLFSMEGFVGDGAQEVEVRNVRTSQDVKMPLRQLVEHYQSISHNAQPGERTRFYGKDIDCPDGWEKWIASGPLPAHLHPFGPSDMFAHLPSEHRPETLMCYLGIGDTFTPAHKDLCGSFGQNLMCHTADGASAFWFMTATGKLYKDEPALYFHDKLGVELDHEHHTATVEELARAPFGIYVAEQRKGDLVLVPPRSCHQVVNHGGLTIKMSWSRMGLQSLRLSMYDELPLYHRVCRRETYRVKLTIFHAIVEYTERLASIALPTPLPSPPSSDIPFSRLPMSSCRDPSPPAQPTDLVPRSSPVPDKTLSVLKDLLLLFDNILIEEWTPHHTDLKHVPVPLAGFLRELHVCDYCGADIFQSFFACPVCAGADPDEFVCCASCYVEGRACACVAGIMEPRQSQSFDDLVLVRNRAADAINARLPPGERLLSRCTPPIMEKTEHVLMFHAACKLRERKLAHWGKPRGKPTGRCTMRAHEVPTTQVLYCGKCHAGICFAHILEAYGVHAAEALLRYAKDADQNAWHERHTHVDPRRPLLLGERRHAGPPPLARRMAWVATTFRRCRPLCLARVGVGFYDEVEVAVAVAVVSAPEAVRAVGNPIRKAGPTVAQLINPESPLTSLSDSESDMDLDSSTEWSPPPQPRKRPVQPRTLGLKPSVNLIWCVDIPRTREKRRIAANPAASSSPPKRAKKADPPQTPSPVHRPVLMNPTPASTHVPEFLRFHQPTVVPVATPSRARVPLAAPPVSKAPRFGRPHRHVRRPAVRRISSPRESSPDRGEPSTPALPSSPGRLPAAPPRSSTPAAPVDDENSWAAAVGQLSALLEAVRKEKEAALVREAALKVEVATYKASGPARQAIELRAQVRKLTADLEECTKRAQASEQRAQAAERRVVELTDNANQLHQAVQVQQQCITMLRSQVEQGQSSVAEKERTLGGLANIAGLFGHSIGVALTNGTPPPNAPGSQWAAHPLSGGQFPQPYGPQMQVASTAGVSRPYVQPAPWRFKGGQLWTPPRGRGKGKRGGSHASFSPGMYPTKGAQAQRLPREHEQPCRGREQYPAYRGRARTQSPGRRSAHESRHPYARHGSLGMSDQQYQSRHRNEPRGRSYSPLASASRHDERLGDGGWANVQGARSPSYSAVDTYESFSQVHSPARTAYSGSTMFRQGDAEVDLEPEYRPCTPDAPTVSEPRRDLPDDIPLHEQLEEDALGRPDEGDTQDEQPPTNDKHEGEAVLPGSLHSWSDENPWASRSSP